MQLFWLLFAPQHEYRNFVRLDHKGLCVAFKRCPLPPHSGCWVEVEDFCLSWLQHPLPSNARVFTPAMQQAAMHR